MNTCGYHHWPWRIRFGSFLVLHYHQLTYLDQLFQIIVSERSVPSAQRDVWGITSHLSQFPYGNTLQPLVFKRMPILRTPLFN